MVSIYRAIDILFRISEVGADIPERLARQILEVQQRYLGLSGTLQDVDLAALRIADALKKGTIPLRDVHDLVLRLDNYLKVLGDELGETVVDWSNYNRIAEQSAVIHQAVAEEIRKGWRQVNEQRRYVIALAREYKNFHPDIQRIIKDLDEEIKRTRQIADVQERRRAFAQAEERALKRLMQIRDQLPEQLDEEIGIYNKMRTLLRRRIKYLNDEAAACLRTGRTFQGMIGNLRDWVTEGSRLTRLRIAEQLQRLSRVRPVPPEYFRTLTRNIQRFNLLQQPVGYLERLQLQWEAQVPILREVGKILDQIPLSTRRNYREMQRFVQSLDWRTLSMFVSAMEAEHGATYLATKGLDSVTRELFEQEFALRVNLQDMQRMHEELSKTLAAYQDLMPVARVFTQATERNIYNFRRFSDVVRFFRDTIISGRFNLDQFRLILDRVGLPGFNEAIRRASEQVQRQVRVLKELRATFSALTPMQREALMRQMQMKFATWDLTRVVRRALPQIVDAYYGAGTAAKWAAEMQAEGVDLWKAMARPIARRLAYLQNWEQSMESAKQTYQEFSESEREYIREYARGAVEQYNLRKRLTEAIRASVAELYSEQQALSIPARQYREWGRRLAALIAAMGGFPNRSRRIIDGIRRIGDAFGRAGWRVGFFGWIVSFAGRTIMNMIEELRGHIEDLMKTGANWQKNIESLVTAMSFGAATGVATASSLDILREELERQIRLGPLYESVWALYESGILRIKTAILTEALPAFTAFVNAILMWTRTTAFQDFVAQFASLISTTILPALFQLLDAIAAWAPVLTYVIGLLTALLKVLGPYAPILVFLGTVLWMLGPILTAVGKIMVFMTKVTKLLRIETYKEAIAHLRAKWAKLQDAFATKTLSVALKELLLSMIPVIALLGIFAIGIWAFSQRFQAAMTPIMPMPMELAESFSSAFDDVGSGLTSFERKLYDTSGNLVYTIDMMTGKVYDSSGEMVGYWDSATGDIILDTGEIIRALDKMGTQFVSTKDGFLEAKDDMVTAMEDLTKAVQGVKEAVEKMNEEIARTPEMILESMIESKRLNEALRELEQAFNEIIYSADGLIETVSPAAIQRTAELRDLIRDLAEQGVFTSRQLEFLASIIYDLRDAYIQSTDQAVSFIDSLLETAELTEDERRALELLRRALLELCFRHAAPQAAAFAEELERVNELTRQVIDTHTTLSRTLRQPFGGGVNFAGIGLGNGYGAGYVPQDVTVYANITIENVSSEVDLDELQGAISRGIADALRRRLLGG